MVREHVYALEYALEYVSQILTRKKKKMVGSAPNRAKLLLIIQANLRVSLKKDYFP